MVPMFTVPDRHQRRLVAALLKPVQGFTFLLNLSNHLLFRVYIQQNGNT